MRRDVNLLGETVETLVVNEPGAASTAVDSTRAIHDLLVASAPDGAEHDEATCPFCTPASATDSLEGGMTTYNEDQLRVEVDKATASLREELKALSARLGASETEAALAAAVEEATGPLTAKVEELTAELAELTTKFDEATLEARTATETHDNLVAFLTAEQERLDNEVAATARRDDRLAAVKDVVPSFTEEDLEVRADKWAAMDDEAFTAQLDEYRSIAERLGAGAGDGNGQGAKPPATTAMTAAATTSADKGASATRSTLRDALSLRGTANDPSTLR